MIDASEITTWDDLLDEQFVGEIVSDPIASPGAGQGAMQFLYNVKGEEYVERLVEQEIEWVEGSTQLVEQVARGVAPIALGSVAFEIERFRDEGFDQLEVVLPDDHPGYLASGFGVIVQAQGSPRPNASQVFLNWFASPAGQTVYGDILMASSARSDIETDAVPEYVKPRDGVDYWEDWELDWLLNERAGVSEWLAELQRGER